VVVRRGMLLTPSSPSQPQGTALCSHRSHARQQSGHLRAHLVGSMASAHTACAVSLFQLWLLDSPVKELQRLLLTVLPPEGRLLVSRFAHTSKCTCLPKIASSKCQPLFQTPTAGTCVQFDHHNATRDMRTSIQKGPGLKVNHEEVPAALAQWGVRSRTLRRQLKWKCWWRVL
jgi:hypothetical protein